MRVPHRELERARSDPRSFVRNAAAGAGGHRIGAFRLWQYAVRNYHRRDGDLKAALNYLEGAFRAAFRPGPQLERRLLGYSQHLADYAADFRKLGHVTVDTGVRIGMDLGHGITMIGEIGRVDLVLSGGYSAYVLLKEAPNWREELRMPLIQAYFARELGVAGGTMAVGIFSLATGQHEEARYSERRISTGLREADRLARALALAERRLRPSPSPARHMED